jgi:hypothetical protein
VARVTESAVAVAVEKGEKNPIKMTDTVTEIEIGIEIGTEIEIEIEIATEMAETGIEMVETTKVIEMDEAHLTKEEKAAEWKEGGIMAIETATTRQVAVNLQPPS